MRNPRWVKNNPNESLRQVGMHTRVSKVNGPTLTYKRDGAMVDDPVLSMTESYYTTTK